MATATLDRRQALKQFRVDYANDWCPGCGDFGILGALQQALAGMGRRPHEVVLVGGIGCSGKAQYYVNCYGVHTLHGRPLPFATGIKLANPELTVIIVGGDGDGLGIGAGHFVNAGRRNVDLTYLLFNNEVYGLTQGQGAPTLQLGLKTKSLAEPNIQESVNGPSLAFASGFTWIGRGYSYDVRHLVQMITRAVEHPGLSFLDIVQPCPTYNDLHDRAWFGGEGTETGDSRIYDVEATDYDGRIPAGVDDDGFRAKVAAFSTKALEWGDRIPVGLLLEKQGVSAFGDRIGDRLDAYRTQPPAARAVAAADGRPTADLTAVFDESAVD